MLKITTIIIVISVIAAVLIAKAQQQRKRTTKNTLPDLGQLTDIKRRNPLTEHEQQMFLTLTNALPGCIVLAQVALSALITTTSKSTRNRFDRKVADFVICSKQLAVITVIELDDSSHNAKTEKDADRDAMLANAGYKTIRYSKIPDQNTIRKDIAELILKTSNSSKSEIN